VPQEYHALFDAALFLCRRGEDAVSVAVEKYERFGKTREEMEALLGGCAAFFGAVREELPPLLDRYQELLPYTDVCTSGGSSEKLRSVAICLTQLVPWDNWGAAEGAQLDALVLRLLNLVLSGQWGEELEGLSEREFMDRIYTSETLSADQKLVLIRFCADRRYAVKALYAFLSEVAQIMRRHFPLVRAEYDAFCQALATQEELRRTLLQMLPLQGDTQAQPLRVFVTVAGFNAGSVVVDEGINDFYMGMHLMLLQQLRSIHAMHYVQDLKALADDTRIRIVRMVAKEPLYLQEIAQRLGLTPATVSHHLNILLVERFITAKAQSESNRRLRYTACAEQLRKTASRLLRIAEEATADEA